MQTHTLCYGPKALLVMIVSSLVHFVEAVALWHKHANGSFFLKKGLTGWKKELEKTLKPAFNIQFILSILFLLKICTWKVSDVENVITKRFRIQFTAGRLKTRGSGPVPILSLQKTKVQEQSVQGIEFSIYLSHRSFGPTRPYDTWKSANKSCPQKLMAHFE